MDQEELNERRNKLLDNNNLSNGIDRMLHLKDLPAKAHSVTLITGRDGRTEIVVELYIDVLNTAKIARAYLYLTEDIYNREDFDFVDHAIGPAYKNLPLDTLILLRALRVIFNVIYNISTSYVNHVDNNKTIYIRTNQYGCCDYTN